jgi:conjugation system TraG family ATPase
MTKRLDELWPILGVEQDVILSRSGDVTLAFDLKLPEIFTLSDKDYEAFHHSWVQALKALPAHTALHKQDWFRQVRYQANFSGEEPLSFLSLSSERYFHERPCLVHRCQLMLTRMWQPRKPSTSLLCGLTRGRLVPEQMLQPQILQEFHDQVGQFCRILEESGFVSLTRLRGAELSGGPTRPGLMERYFFLREGETPVQLQDVEFADHLRVGDFHCRLFTLAEASGLPGLCGARITYEGYSTDTTPFSVGFAAGLGLLLPCDHLYNQYIFTVARAQTLRALERKRRRLQSLSAYSRENLVARDATHHFLQEAIGEGRIPVKAHFNVLVWAEDAIGIRKLKPKISAAMSTMDAVTRLETAGAPQIFWAGIPGNAGDFPINDTFDTFAEQACCFLNLETAYRNSRSPVGLRLGDRLSGTPLQVDLSDEPLARGICTNRNKFILGPSGSGKSFFTNHLVRSYYEQGAHILLVDVGHSYQRLCALLKGYYFTYEESDPIRFNPFHTPDGQSPDTEKKESLKTLLLALWKRENETFGRAEYVALSAAVTGYYTHLSAHPEIFPCFNSFYDYLRDGFKEVLARDGVKPQDFDLDNLLYVLRPYYRGGEFDYLLNARENLHMIDQRFIVFELDHIKDHPILFPVVTIIIMEIFIQKMRRLHGIRKMILIEEAWKAIARQGMAEYIRYLFKTVRKFFGEAVVVTQEIDDIISSPVVKETIIHNSDCKILLDQSKYQQNFDRIQQLLGLTDKEKTLVLSLNKANDPSRRYKEVFISLGGTLSKVYRVEVSAEEYLTYTTEQAEQVRVTTQAARQGDLQQGIALLAREMRTTASPAGD